jgi:hypothetical protein
MRTIKLLFLFSFFTFCLINSAQAKGIPIPVSFGGEKINEILNLPNDSTTMYSNGSYLNIACIYKQFSILWIPIWNWDEEYCISIEGSKDHYGEKIDKERAEEIAKIYDLKLPSASPSFWNKFGGKLIILALLALILSGAFSKKSKKTV